MAFTNTRALVLAIAAGFSQPALAQGVEAEQSDAPQAAAGLGDIVVTAERRATNLQDTPISITAVTAEALEAQGADVINDLAVPNLTSTTGPQGSADANFFVRGIGQFDFIVTNDPGVGLYVDGVYIGRTVGAMLDAGDIARVEVLRGPQGTLFGRNTLGGAVSVISQAPDPDAFSGRLRATAGERNRVDLDGGLNIPLGDGSALRAFAFVRQQDGFATRPLDGAEFGATDRYGGRAVLRLAPSDAVTIDLSADYSRDESNPAPSVALAVAPAPFFPADAAADVQNPARFYTVFASNEPESENDVFGLSATVSWDLGAATLKSITAYRDLVGFSTSDPDGTRYRLYDQAVDTEQNQFSQELQITGDALDGRISYLGGVYYFREEALQELRLCFAPITPVPTAPFNACNTWTQRNDQETESVAVFGQLRYNLTETLSATIGGRFTDETKSIISTHSFDFRPAGVSPFASFAFGVPSTLIGARIVQPIVTNLPGEASFDRFTPRLGVEWRPNDDLLIFASYAQGFRSGGFNGRIIAPQATVPTYEPDTNDAYEIGFKSDLFGGRARLNATVFHSTYEGIQQTITDPAVQFRVANAGDASLTGAELELSLLPTDAFRLDLGLGYTKSEFENVPAAVGPINGNALPFSPEWTVSLGAQYEIDLGADGTLTPRVDYRYQTDVFFTAFNLPFEQQDAYGLLSARLTWRPADDRFLLAVFGENLTDEEYYTFGQNALGNQGVAYSYIGRPREVGVTLSYEF